MGSSRLGFALEAGAFELPDGGRVALWHPQDTGDLAVLAGADLQVLSPDAVMHARLQERGLSAAIGPDGPYALSIVTIPRAKGLAMDLIARAPAATPGGMLVINGAKTDGVDAALRACKARTRIIASVSKAHGKVFVLAADAALADLAAPAAALIEGRYHTGPGVFSADGIDPASRMLADHLPARLGAAGADLGAGWGYLSDQALSRDPGSLHLVEANADALALARRNVTDPRARFHWADATRWTPDAPLDFVIMNPPFHTLRKSDPGLGIAFIQSAARCLKPSGQLWMVANRHLPYEEPLARCFDLTKALASDGAFKILHAAKPSRRVR